jgi:hypothetical protein
MAARKKWGIFAEDPRSRLQWHEMTRLLGNASPCGVDDQNGVRHGKRERHQNLLSANTTDINLGRAQKVRVSAPSLIRPDGAIA